MSVRDVLKTAMAQGVYFYLKNGKLAYKAKMGALSESLKQSILNHKDQIIDYLVNEERQGQSQVLSDIKPIDRSLPIPLSFSQQRLWFIDQLENHKSQYNLTGQFLINGELDLSALESSLNTLIARHEVLRTNFQVKNNEPCQIINEKFTTPFSFIDLSKHEGVNSSSKIEDVVKTCAQRRFDLANDLLIEFKVIKIAHEKYIVFYVMHHIVSDGWSRGIIQREVSELYNAIISNRDYKLPELTIQYADYSKWQRDYLSAKVIQQGIEYWQNHLQGLPHVHSIPLDNPRPPKPTYKGKTKRYIFDDKVTRKIRDFNNRHGTTIFMFIQSALVVLFSRYSGENDIVIGTASSGRNQKSLENLVGFFINDLVIRSNVNNELTFEEFLTNNKKTILDAFSQQHIPFEVLVEKLNPQRSASYSPLYQIKLDIQNNQQSSLKLSNVKSVDARQKSRYYKNQDSVEKEIVHNIKHDLYISVQELKDTISITWRYATDIFNDNTVERFNQYLNNILSDIFENGSKRISDLALISKNEADVFIRDIPLENRFQFKGDDVIKCFEHFAKVAPEHVAVSTLTDQQSYKKLNQAVNRLAVLIKNQKLASNSKIAICMERSSEMMTAILAILKAGHAFVPIDPHMPQQRINTILQDCNCPLVLTQNELMEEISFERVKAVPVDSKYVAGILESFSDIDINVQISPQDIAYVIYTSGSTGVPKGVVVKHKALFGYCVEALNQYYSTGIGGALVLTAYNFDLTLPSLFLPLMTGGTVQLMTVGDEIGELKRKLTELKAPQLIRLTPSHLSLLINEYKEEQESEISLTNHSFVIGGEALANSLVNKLRGLFPKAALFNHYGPTEAVVGATLNQLAISENISSIYSPIGTPMSNKPSFVLDKQLQLCAPGIVGELYIGGNDLSDGYLNDTALTRSKFITNPIKESNSRILYKTGDLVRWVQFNNNEKPVLEYFGRTDDQVKLRGLRIELGDIENYLNAQQAISKSAVSVFKTESNDSRLVAYVCLADSNLLAAEEEAELIRKKESLVKSIKEQLSGTIPEYMVPQIFIFVEELPLTKTGKLDRKRLPEPSESDLVKTHYVAPSSDLESKMCEAWQTVLELQQVGIEDDFFMVGGHSLLATKLVNLIRSDLGVEIPLRAIFENSKLVELCQFIETHGKTSAMPIPVRTKSGDIPLSYAQQRLWFIDQLGEGSSHYNVTGKILANESICMSSLAKAFSMLLDRHEVLRTTIVDNNGGACQVINTITDPVIDYLDFSQSTPSQIKLELFQFIESRAKLKFDLSNDLMIKITVISLPDERSLITYTMHHIASDGWSRSIFEKELMEFYYCYKQNDSISKLPLKLQYADYAIWQKSLLNDNEIKTQLDYWKGNLQRIPKTHSIPLDYPRPEKQSFTGRKLTKNISGDLNKLVYKFCQQHDVTLFMLVHAVYALVLGHYSQNKSILMGTPISGRVHKDLEELIGMFVNSLVLKTEVNQTDSFLDLLKKSKSTVLEAFENQDVPFEMLVEELCPERDLAYNPIYQFMLVFPNDHAKRQNTKSSENEPAPGILISNDDLDNTVLRTDIDLYVNYNNSGINLTFKYSDVIFKPETIELLSTQFVNILDEVLSNPLKVLSDLNFDKPDQALILNAESVAADVTEDLGLSFHQQRLWFIESFERGVVYEGGPSYHNIPLLLHIEGDCNANILERSVNEVLDSFALTQRVYSEKDSGLFISDAEKDSLKLYHESVITQDMTKYQAIEYAINKSKQCFDFTSSRLVSLQLIRYGADKNIFLMTIHHMLVDRPSIKLLSKLIRECYIDKLNGKSKTALKANRLIDNLTCRESSWSKDPKVYLPHIAYWRSKLGSNVKALELPQDYPRKHVHEYIEGRYHSEFDSSCCEAVKHLSKELNITEEVFFLAAFKALLFKYTQHNEVVVGAVIDKRQRINDSSALGMFQNYVPIRDVFNNDDDFHSIVKKVHQTFNESVRYSDIPFDLLTQKLQLEVDMSRTVLFDVLFQYEVDSEVESINELTNFEHIDTNLGFGKYDLNVLIKKQNDNYAISVVYNKDFYKSETVSQTFRHFQNLIKQVLTNSHINILSMDLLDEQDRQQQLRDWNKADPEKSVQKTVYQKFEENVVKNPDSVALVLGTQCLTYRELNVRANKIAHYLVASGICQDDKVGLYVNRSIEMVIGILAIVKAGAAYVPIDPAIPKNRTQFIVNDSRIDNILTEKSFFKQLDDYLDTINVNINYLCIEGGEDKLGNDLLFEGQSQDNVKLKSKDILSSLAYVIYTSGSTGNPKGVLIEHANITNLLSSCQGVFDLKQSDIWTLFHSFAFDFSVWELWGCLTNSAKLIIIPQQTAQSPEDFYELLLQEKVTILNQTPSMFKEVISVDNKLQKSLSLKNIIFGGEALDFSILKSWFERHPEDSPRLVNMYGITETTVHVTFHPIKKEEAAGLTYSTIGKKLPHLELYILSEQMNLLPKGLQGEIYVGGSGVARGYINSEQLNKAHFVPNPFKEKERLYKTGDLGRFLSDGNVQYLGRKDHQIKIRGFRIELGEIEKVICNHNAVSSSVAIVHESSENDRRIIVYVVLKTKYREQLENSSTRELTDHILKTAQAYLPKYMLPSAVIAIESIPLTVNGKLDKKSLPSPLDSLSDASTYQAPDSEIESKLCDLWQNTLKVNKVGTNDNFFKLGGHSLLATRLVSAIRREFNIEMPIRTLFEYPTVKELSEIVKSTTNKEVLPPVEKVNRDNKLPLSYAQQRLWFIDKLGEGSTEYNMPGYYLYSGNLNRQAFSAALETLIWRHEILRTQYIEDKDDVYQVIATQFELPLKFIDLSGERNESKRSIVSERLKQEAEKPFDLKNDLMVRLCVIKLEDSKHLIHYTIHHIAGDGWSIKIFKDELNSLYESGVLDAQSQLAPLRVQYADYAVWQRQWLSGELLKKQIDYWKEQLAGIPAVHDLPLDKPRPSTQKYEGRAFTQIINKELTKNIYNLCEQHGVSLFILLETAFAVLVSRYSNQKDVVIGSPIAGRTHSDLDSLIGFFVNSIVVRTEVNDDLDFAELLTKNKTTIFDAFEHQHVPFEMLVEEIRPERDLSYNSLFQILFVVQNTETEKQEDLANINDSEKASLFNERDVRIRFDLALHVTENSDDLSIRWSYRNYLFKESSIKRMANSFRVLLESIISSLMDSEEKKLPICQLNLLTNEELDLLENSINDTQKDHCLDTCFHEMFEAQVERTPNNQAIIFEDSTLSYREFNQLSNRLASYLIFRGIGRDSIVAINIKRSVESMIALMGVLKAGAGYVPLEPNLPTDRMKYILNDSGARLVITEPQYSDIKAYGDRSVIVLEQKLLEELKSEFDDKNPSRDSTQITSNSLAYVIYTSGTTGQPKGVMINHASLSNFLLSVKDKFLINDVVGSIVSSSLTFDATIQSLYLPLIDGRSVELLPDDDQLIANLAEYLVDDEEAYLFKITPTHLKALVNQASIVRNPLSKHVIVVAGETLTRNNLLPWFELLPNAKFINEYGPTEGTVGSCIFEINDIQSFSSGQSIPIGFPLDNVSFYVFDKNKNLAPFGVVGELYIGGKGLAREYLNQPQLTKSKFIEYKINHRDSIRLYKTGDLVRWVENYGLEFVGRVDDQIKIRGYRIELTEIQTVIESMDLVRDSVVIANASEEESSLIAYLVPTQRYLDDAALEYNKQHVEQWTSVNDDKYGDDTNHIEDVNLNFFGWNSSYTGQPIQQQQMEQWVEETLSRILKLSPKNLFEIGCGQGLFLYRYAESCNQVYATDISKVALDGIKNELTKRNWNNVALELGDALHFDHLDNTAIDTIVINSVSQYFPNQKYLDEVLLNAINCVEPGGKIFIGDVRNLDLFESHLCAIERSRINQSISAGTFSSRIQRRKIKEPELLISPSYFANLKESIQSIDKVDILVKRGVGDNEMLRYRYDVVITKSEKWSNRPVEHDNVDEFKWIEFNGITELRRELELAKDDTFGVFAVPNYRVLEDVELSSQIKGWSKDRVIIPQQNKGLLSSESVNQIIELEKALNFAENQGYRCEITWSQESLDKLDIIFSQSELPELRAHADYNKLTLVNCPQLPAIATEIATKVRKSLNSKLPEYMVPSVFICLEEMPLTVSGKIDKKSLPTPEDSDREKSVYQPPTNNIQEKLCKIWAELLDLKQVGITDNFFALGGHSLLATRLISLVREAFRTEIPLRALFESPTIGDFSKLIEAQSTEIVLPDIDVVDKSNPLPLSYAQQRLWVIDQFNQNSVQYNMPARYLVKGEFNLKALKKAFKCVLERHQVLRTCFVEYEHTPKQVIQDKFDLPFSFIDISLTSSQQLSQKLSDIIDEETNTPFDLSKDIMIRVKVVKIADESHLILYTMHHIASDGWSVGVFRNEISQLYAAFASDEPNPLKPLKIQYADFAMWQKQWLEGELLRKGLNYWRNQLKLLPVTHGLPLDYRRPNQQTYSGRIYRQFINRTLSQKIQRVCEKHEVTLFMVLQTALAVLVSRFSNQSDIVIGTPIAGRNHSDLESLIGFFINTLVIRTKISSDTSICDLLKQNKETILDAYGHQYIPFEMLVDELQPKRSLSFNPLVQILFAVQNTQKGYLNFQESNDFASNIDKAGNIKEVSNIKFDLEINVHEQQDGLSVSWGYNTSLFEQESIFNFANSYQNLLNSIADCLLQGILDKPTFNKSFPGTKNYLTLLEENQLTTHKNSVVDLQSQKYWQEQFTSGIPSLLLPTDYARKDIQCFQEAKFSVQIGRKLSVRLQSLSRRQGVDYSVLLLASFSLLLSRYTNSQKILLGTYNTKQTNGTESDYFNNQLILVNVDSEDTFEQFLNSTAQSVLASKNHQDLPLSKLLELINPICGLSYAPLHQVSFAVETQVRLRNTSNAKAETLKTQSNDYNSLLSNIVYSNTDIGLVISEDLKGTLCTINYNKSLYEESTIEKMLLRYVGLLKGAIEDVNKPVSDLHLPETYVNRINLSDHNGIRYLKSDCNNSPGTKANNLMELIEKQAQSNPEQLVAQDNNGGMTLESLNGRANQLARKLKEKNVDGSQVVALFIKPSNEFLISLLAVLKTGASVIYLPEELPRLKIYHLIEKYNVKTLLFGLQESNRDLPSRLARYFSQDFNFIEFEISSKYSSANLNKDFIKPSTRALIINQTSESGSRRDDYDISHSVLIESVNSLLSFNERLPGIQDLSKESQASVQIFDYLVMLARNEVIDFSESTSSVVNNVNSIGNTSINSGDLFKSFINRCLFASHLSVIKDIQAEQFLLDGKQHKDVLVVKNHTNLPCYILNADLSAVPEGGIGNLFISFSDISLGYAKNASLTAECFIPNQFAQSSGQRLYNSGFLARVLPNRLIEIISSSEKARVYSFDKLEQLLKQSQLTDDVFIKAIQSQNRIHYACYLKLNQNERESGNKNLNNRIYAVAKNQSELVPIPTHIMKVDHFNYHEDGSINSNDLEIHLPINNESSIYVKPRNQQEELLCDIWKGALNAKQVGINDNFFELGGNSLIATRVISHIRKELQVELEIKLLFESPTIAELCSKINASNEQSVVPTIKKVERHQEGGKDFEEVEF
ncbi:amino acid adenylation domain-containing protein [Aliikangiella marina]|uniref:Amino acid adenylation domain-containing protein n=1 Tax=Aliikangiella marina TaxID=1712262 RepID=A0A545TJL8_9GAMM|nr:non-ribosomal peptide synthetase [Aliikangiella marina]TQV77376.1 amino acid adenylation domain-containing protein [Aliikangiella marina]